MTYPLPTLACTISSTGITAPSYADILASLQASFQSIYGSDAYLDADSQDGQLLAVFAAAINDVNAQTIAVYNAFSPATAQGEGLSRVVKINGLRRHVATNSTVDVTLVGQIGTVITNGQVGDVQGNTWNLPASVTIPTGGSITVTATCAVLGDITAAAGDVSKILTPTRGWQTVTNAAAATAGAPVETDASLRKRQAISTALPAQSVLDAMIGAVANLSGIGRLAAYENATGATDGNGIPAHSVAFVVEGGDATDIATTIALKKAPGVGTYGTTTETIIDPAGLPNAINFYRPTSKRVIASITIKALTGYVATTATAITQAMADYVSALDIGADVLLTKLYGPANLPDIPALGATFNITDLEIAFYGGTLAASDLVLAFNEAASLAVADITITVT